MGRAVQFHHIGISVADIERSIAFYRDMLGMDVVAPPFSLAGPEVESVMGLRDVEVRTSVVGNGSLMLELFEFAAPDPAGQDPDYSVANHGISHFGVTVPDIDSVYDRLRASGVRFHSAVQTFPSGIRAAYGRDPDGNVFELLEMPEQGAA